MFPLINLTGGVRAVSRPFLVVQLTTITQRPPVASLDPQHPSGHSKFKTGVLDQVCLCVFVRVQSFRLSEVFCVDMFTHSSSCSSAPPSHSSAPCRSVRFTLYSLFGEEGKPLLSLQTELRQTPVTRHNVKHKLVCIIREKHGEKRRKDVLE